MVWDIMTNCLTYVEQVAQALLWDGQSLAPRGYKVGCRVGEGTEHPSSSQKHIQTTNQE